MSVSDTQPTFLKLSGGLFVESTVTIAKPTHRSVVTGKTVTPELVYNTIPNATAETFGEEYRGAGFLDTVAALDG